MKLISDAVVEFFKEQEWPYGEIEGELIDEDESGFRTTFSGQSGEFNCLGLVDETKRMFVFYAFAPAPASDEKLVDMMEFITRANYDMYIGNFELDLSDGEIRFKASVDFDESEATQPIIKGIVFMAVLMMDRYFPGIKQVLDGTATPVAAVGEVEDNWQPPSSEQVSG